MELIAGIQSRRRDNVGGGGGGERTNDAGRGRQFFQFALVTHGEEPEVMSDVGKWRNLAAIPHRLATGRPAIKVFVKI
jgi:hypothetical protein